MSQHLFFGFRDEGFDVVCMEIRQVNAVLSAMLNKTDKNDARGIAQVLRIGWFSPVHMKSRAIHDRLTDAITEVNGIADINNDALDIAMMSKSTGT